MWYDLPDTFLNYEFQNEELKKWSCEIEISGLPLKRMVHFAVMTIMRKRRYVCTAFGAEDHDYSDNVLSICKLS